MPSRSESETGLAQRAYLTMRQRILRGDYAMGQVISRRRIAADLGVSFLPASEALLRLECEGILESRPRAGTRIRIPTPEDVQGHFMVREALEVQAAILFAERATEEQRAELGKLAGRVDSRSRKANAEPLAYIDLHEKLHLKVARYTECPELEAAIGRMSALDSAWLCAMRSVRPPQPPDHENLMRALAKQKPALAGAAMRSHIQAEMQGTLCSLQPLFELSRKYVQTYSRTIRRQTEGARRPSQPVPEDLQAFRTELSEAQSPAA